MGIAAKRDIGLNEAYMYIPTKLIICESQILKTEIAHIVSPLKKLVKKEYSAQFLLKFFLMHEISKGKDSFWYPYFKITEKPDLLIIWTEEELGEL